MMNGSGTDHGYISCTNITFLTKKSGIALAVLNIYAIIANTLVVMGQPKFFGVSIFKGHS